LKPRINKIFLEPGRNNGPRKFCDICKVYYVWFSGKYLCPACGSRGTADDVIASSRKVLKADVPTPLVAGKKKKTLKADPDLPEGANWITDETYNP